MSSAKVEGARITISNLGNGASRETITGPDGLYRIQSLDVGTYTVRVQSAGLRDEVIGNVRLSVEREAWFEHWLQPAAQRESTTVTATVRQVDASLSGLSNLIQGETIAEQPLNGRDYLRLALLQPGVIVARSKSRSSNTGYGLQLSIGGSRPVQNNFRLDGISLTDQTGSSIGSVNGTNLGTDALREFSVLTNGFSAEYGRAAGGVVNAVTRSGENTLHGTSSYYHRNDQLDARNYFDPANQPEFRRHQYAGTIGGPIRHDRTFFFGGFEGLRQLRGNTATNTTISDAARNGLAGGQRVTIDPAIGQVLKLFPSPNGAVTGDTGIFSYTNDTDAKETFGTLRLDHRLSERHSLFGRYTIDDAQRLELSPFAINHALNRTRQQSAAIEATSILSPSLTNSARFGMLRTVSLNNITQAVDAAADDPRFVFVPGGQAMGRIDVVGLSLFPGGSGSLDFDDNAFTSFQLYNDVSYVRGHHWLKAGVMLERTRFNSNSQSLNAGEFRFPSVQSFLLNRPDRFRALLPGADTMRGFRQWIGGWYVQDRWQLLPRFSLELGVRHEGITVPTEVQGKLANLDSLLSPAMRVDGPLFENPSRKNFAPRAGFAWDVFGHGWTVVRGGYGIYHDQLLSQFLLNAGVRNPPAYRGASVSNNVGAFPSAAYTDLVSRPTLDLRAERLPRHPSQPYVQQWNFNIQQRLGKAGNLRIAYAGSHGLHLSAIVEDANLAPSITLPDGRLFFPDGGSKANPNFGVIRDRLFDAQSSYHSLQTGWDLRLRDRLTLSVAYVLAKSIDDDSSTFTQNDSDNSIGLPITGNSRFNRGLSNHDQRHNFVMNFTAELGTPSSRALRKVFGGWRLSSIATAGSGSPFSATLSYDAARTLTVRPDRRGGQRPDLAPGRSGSFITGDPNAWFDVTAFQRPAPGFLGNLGRNTLTGPGFVSVDGVLVKRLVQRERCQVDLRLESFNVLNHANFDLPLAERTQIFSRTAVREDAGRITSASPGREVQIGIKVLF